MFYGGLIYTGGWAARAAFTQNPTKDLYIAQMVMILCGPPIYSAAEYNVLARIMHYVPMHAPIGPNRTVFFFTYLSALIETLTAAGAAMQAGATTVEKWDRVKLGSTLIAIAVVLQTIAQAGFAFTVALVHHRVSKANMLTSNLRSIFIMLYGTSTLVIIRCIYRSIEKFSTRQLYETLKCEGSCTQVIAKEWYLYAFDAAPMILYTIWINIIHPGRFLPHGKNHFLDFNRIERVGPVLPRPQIRWMSLVDMGLGNKGDAPKDKYWERPQEWPAASDANGSPSRSVEEGLKEEKSRFRFW
jgi:hypothetical protein